MPRRSYWSFRSRDCTSCARPLPRTPASLLPPQAEALATAFGVSAGLPPDRFRGPVTWPCSEARATRRGRRRPLFYARGRRPVARPGLRADALAGVRGKRMIAEPLALIFATREQRGRDDLAGLPELIRCTGWTTPTPARCWTRAPKARWTSGSATASSPRPAAIPSPCWTPPRPRRRGRPRGVRLHGPGKGDRPYRAELPRAGPLASGLTQRLRARPLPAAPAAGR